jgi:hypothetical protein
MSAAKLILLGLAVISLLVVAAVVFWVKYYAKDFGEEAAKSAQITRADGARFGKTTNVDGCLKKTIDDSANCGTVGFICLADKQTFLQSCAAAAPDFQARCRDMPKGDDVIAHITWEVETCESFGQGMEERCHQLVRRLPSQCARATRPVAQPVP